MILTRSSFEICRFHLSSLNNNFLRCRYLWLDKLLPKTDLRTIIIKILADQFFAAPFFAITFFFGMGILEDKRMSECWKEFVKKFPAVYLVSNRYFFCFLSHSLFVICIHLLTVRLVYLATYPVHKFCPSASFIQSFVCKCSDCRMGRIFIMDQALCK